MSKTAKGLLEHCRNAKNWKYVYGAKGTVLTKKEIQALKDMYGSLVWDTDLNKAGNVCCDCSGLLSSYTWIIRSSSNYKFTATDEATISELKKNWKNYIGWGIWMNGHIGVVSDTEGYYYAMDGSARNWVHNPISMQNWTCVIKLKDIDYSENKEVNNTSKEKENTNTKKKETAPSVFYRAYANGKWYSEVENYNNTSSKGYAGVEKRAISGVMAKLSKGDISTRVHLKNGNRWLPWVDRYNIKDSNNGYAGILGKTIDAVQFKITGLTGYDVKYRVSTIDSTEYLPWVYGISDYAGVYGKEIDKIQIEIVKK